MKIKMQKNSDNKKIEEAFAEFITMCKAKNLSSKTILYYQDGYNVFTGFYDKDNLASSISKKTLNEFILYLTAKASMNTMSINTRLKSLRAFLNFCMSLGYIEKFKVELLKCEKPIKVTYTDSELNLLLTKPDIRKCDFAEYRNWAIENYLLSTGNRLSTLINLKIEDLDFDNMLISMKVTKNRKQQIIPMSNTLKKILIEYLQYRGGNSDDYLFCNQTGTQLTKASIEHAIQQYNKRRGVTKTSIHLFRHTFAKKWILAGGDIFRLQKILGHSSLDIVKEYVNMFSDDLKMDFNTFNPLEQLTINKEHIKMHR